MNTFDGTVFFFRDRTAELRTYTANKFNARNFLEYPKISKSLLEIPMGNALVNGPGRVIMTREVSLIKL